MEPEVLREYYSELLAEWQAMTKSLDPRAEGAADEEKRLSAVKKKLDSVKKAVFAAGPEGGGARDAAKRKKAREALRTRIDFLKAKMDDLQKKVGAGA